MPSKVGSSVTHPIPSPQVIRPVVGNGRAEVVERALSPFSSGPAPSFCSCKVVREECVCVLARARDDMLMSLKLSDLGHNRKGGGAGEERPK